MPRRKFCYGPAMRLVPIILISVFTILFLTVAIFGILDLAGIGRAGDGVVSAESFERHRASSLHQIHAEGGYALTVAAFLLPPAAVALGLFGARRRLRSRIGAALMAAGLTVMLALVALIASHTGHLVALNADINAGRENATLTRMQFFHGFVVPGILLGVVALSWWIHVLLYRRARPAVPTPGE